MVMRRDGRNSAGGGAPAGCGAVGCGEEQHATAYRCSKWSGGRPIPENGGGGGNR